MKKSRWISSLLALGIATALSSAGCGGGFPGGRTLAEDTAQSPPGHQGATPRDPQLAARLVRALAERGPGYVPRTHHLAADGRPLFVNRLILEASPYLEQHAHNPVDWYPWGAEAFDRARRENKPVFLSIGYSTCHWCHVMERESFEDLEVARMLNESFVAIKVDREQRPDVDELYMTAVMVMGQRGGWPLSSFLTPEGKSFFGATYFPREQFLDLLTRVRDSWSTQREAIDQSARQIGQRVAQVVSGSHAAKEVDRSVAAGAVSALLAIHDEQRGGFGGAPKFPHEPDLLLLLDAALRDGNAAALEAADRTLSAMARGGIHDQVGGGFHRYSTDADWLVPHFEKMLYNQAHLARCYLAAWQLTGNPLHRRVAGQILRYVRREMTAPDGAFFSATDADSEGREGVYFLWTPEELSAVLSEEDADLAKRLFGVRDGGNFEGESILHLPRALDAFAGAEGVPLERFLERVDRIRDQLWAVRRKRVPPLRDGKVLVAWNSMMITAFATAYEVLGEPADLESASRAAERIWATQWQESGELWRVRLRDEVSVPGLQEDYAYLLEALLSLADATGEPQWLKRARQVEEALWGRFWDEQAGGFFMTAKGSDPLLTVRPKSPDDGAIPSGGSVAARALAQLALRIEDVELGERASAAIAAMGGAARARPGAYSYLLLSSREWNEGAAGAGELAAHGHVRLTGRRGAGGELRVRLEIAPGWHINAHQPLSEDLIATTLRLAGGGGEPGLGTVSYPPAERVKLGFQEAPLAIYQGSVEIEAELEPADDSAAHQVVRPEIELQACDERRCLPPEVARLEIPRGGF